MDPQINTFGCISPKRVELLEDGFGLGVELGTFDDVTAALGFHSLLHEGLVLGAKFFLG